MEAANVIEWTGRPKRSRKAPLTYWEQYGQTDTWYTKKLLEDVPADEVWAACEDEELSDVGEEGDSDLQSCSEDADFNLIDDQEGSGSSDDDDDEDDESVQGSQDGL